VSDQRLDLKILVLNAENLFLLGETPLTKEDLNLDAQKWALRSTSIFENKPKEKCEALAKIILQEKPDLVLLCEVGGFESLEKFNQLFLNETYSPALIEGNSDRSIDVGFLIKKNQPFFFDIHTNKNKSFPLELEAPGQLVKFSRDVAELHLFTRDRDTPFMILFLTHLKSRLDPEGKDPNGYLRRKAELLALIEIYKQMQSKWNGQIPIVVAGDFNGNASEKNTDPEFIPLYQHTDLKDVCWLAQKSDDDRATYYQVSRNNRTEARQIDFAFLSPLAQKLLVPESVQVYRYRDHLGTPYSPPTSLDEKMRLPSDHYPLIFQLRGIKI
jgi:hypothetical protein